MLPTANLFAGWIGMAGGVLSGAAIGVFFHDEGWMGGYGSFRRRLVRLGHISFFGLGFVNVLYALSVAAAPIPASLARAAGPAFVAGLVSMPLCCFLTAWRKPMRILFPVPVLSLALGIGCLLLGWLRP